MATVEKVIIVGSGPAGWTAGLYNARANMSPLLFAGTPKPPDVLPGGQLMTTTEVENYPGFENGIMGPDLMAIMRKQAERFGCRVVEKDVTNVDFTERPFRIWSGDIEYHTWTVIIATGARPRRLGIAGENDFFGRGVSSCAVCDGAFFRDKTVCIVGGGDSSMEEATYLTHHASKVSVIHRRNELRASKIMQQRAFDNPKIEFVWDTTITEVIGNTLVEGVRLLNKNTDMESILPVDGMFLAIGHIPNTDLFEGHIHLNDEGYIKVTEHQETNINGVFAAGDCHDHTWRQAITAAGFGCAAALAAERYLGGIESNNEE